MSMMCYLILSTFFACPLPPEENSDPANNANTINRVATNQGGKKGGNQGGAQGGNNGGQGNTSVGPGGGRQFLRSKWTRKARWESCGESGRSTRAGGACRRYFDGYECHVSSKYTGQY